MFPMQVCTSRLIRRHWNKGSTPSSKTLSFLTEHGFDAKMLHTTSSSYHVGPFLIQNNSLPLHSTPHQTFTFTKMISTSVTNNSRDIEKRTPLPTGTSSTNQDADSDIQPVLSAMTRNDTTVQTYSEVIPGKGPPPEPPVECCMSGCANCVWIQYAEELRDYYKDGNERALKEINKIENEGLKAFIKLELGLR